MEQLSSTDSAFIYAEDRKLPMHVTTATIYDPSTAPQGKVRLKEIMNLFERAVYNVPMFRQRLVEVPLGLDQPYWVEDPDFDIEYHVRHVALPKPGDWRQFYIQVARMTTRPLDRSRPLWEVYVVEGLNNLEGVPAGSFAVVMKLHHASLKGEALRSLFGSLNTRTPEAPTEQPQFQRALQREILRGNLPLLINAAQNNFARSLKASRVMRDAYLSLRRIRKGQALGDLREPAPVPPTRFNGAPSPHRSVTSYSMLFEDAQAARSTLEGATVNDLAMTIIGGAMRRYLINQSELPDDSVVGQVLMGIKEGEPLNPDQRRLSPVNVPLRSDIEDDLERFYAVHDEAEHARRYLKARGVEIGEEVAASMNPLAARSVLKVQESLGQLSLLKHFYPASPNTTISNMPGPLDTVYFCGARIVTSFGFGPCMPEIGLVHTVTSAAGQLTIGVNACRVMLPNPEFYQSCLQESWQQLQQLLVAQRQRPQRARNKATPAASA